MSIEFEPFNISSKINEFSTWDVQDLNGDKPIKISEEEILANERERLRQEAKEKGYAEGLQQAQEDVNNKIEELANWMNILHQPMQLIDAELTQELIQTVIWLSEHCIGVTLSVNPDQLHALLEQIKIELPSVRGNKTLVMNPDDAQWIKTEIGVNLIPGLHDALVEDPLLHRGDFYIKGENSQLDGCLQTRLATLFGKYIDAKL